MQVDMLLTPYLEKNPDDRPASAAELSRLLSASVPSPVWTPERAREWWEAHKPTTTERPLTSLERATTKVTKALR